MLERVTTGGQDGADVAAWRAAKACGLATQGWMPAGFRTAAGDRPEYAAEFGAVEHASRDWPDRTIANILDADATLVFNRGVEHSPGTALAVRICRERRKPHAVINTDALPPPLALAGRIAERGYRALNIGGNRAPHPWPELEAYLTRVFALLVLTGYAERSGAAPAVSELAREMVLRLGEGPK